MERSGEAADAGAAARPRPGLSRKGGPTGTDAVEIAAALDAGRKHQAWALLRKLHPGDAAELLAGLEPSIRRLAVDALCLRFEPRILPYLDEPVRAEVFQRLGLTEAARAFAALESDDAVDLLGDLAEAEREALLAEMPEPRRRIYQQALAYPRASAGRLMQLECAIVPQQWTVGQSLDFLQHAAELPDWLHLVFVVDAEGLPVGAARVDRLVRARRLERIADVMDSELRAVSVLDDERDVARLFHRYGLIAVPVVDVSGHIVGQVTVDDVLDIDRSDEPEPPPDALSSIGSTVRRLIAAIGALMKGRPEVFVLAGSLGLLIRLV